MEAGALLIGAFLICIGLAVLTHYDITRNFWPVAIAAAAILGGIFIGAAVAGYIIVDMIFGGGL